MESARSLPGRMRIAHTDEGGRQNLEPALPLLSQLMRGKAHANFHQRRSPPTRTSDAQATGLTDDQGASKCVERRLFGKVNESVPAEQSSASERRAKRQIS